MRIGAELCKGSLIQGEEFGHQEEKRKRELYEETWRGSSAGVAAA